MKKYIMLLTLAIVTSFIFVACSSACDESDLQPVPDEIPVGFHQFDSLGFSLVFPESWEGRFGLEEFDVEFDFGIRNHVNVHHIATRQDMGHSGTLFVLGRSPRDHYTEDEPPIMAGGTIILAQVDGYTYFVNFPSDVQWNYKEPESEASIEYLEMSEVLSRHGFFTDSFRLID